MSLKLSFFKDMPKRGWKTFVSNCIRAFYEAYAHTLSEKHS